MKNNYKKLLNIIGTITIFFIATPGCSSLLKEKRNFGEGEISLIVPAELMVRIVDGKEINVADIIDGTYTIKFSRGQHSIIFEYIDNWNINSDFANIMRSPPISLTYNYISSNSYLLNYKRPKNADEARTLAKNPKFWLENNGRAIKEGVVNNSISFHSTY